MDEQDRQDKNLNSMNIQNSQHDELKFKELTAKIIGCSFEVSNELGSGFLESSL